MRHLILAGLLVSAAGLTLRAQPASKAAPAVTFAKDVAPILHAKCISCHRPGEVAPMALRTYDEVRPWARAIKQKVVARANAAVVRRSRRTAHSRTTRG